ncbi:MAG: hypothetical protein COA47_14510 [Robiginitomaculum sp.]|nr:MAG: hypothetical protein COA47_14510 [Robiginitomaculum sp.]
MKYIRVVLSIAYVLIITSCTSTDRIGKYRVETIGNARRSIEALVISASQTYIQEQTSGAGAAFGGATGAGIASGSSDNAAVIIAGIIGGMIIGDYIEGMDNIHQATEYVIETSTSAIFTVAQKNGGNDIFKQGDKVILVYGYPARLIRDPR